MPELKRVKQLEKDISIIESKKSRLTDLLIDGKIEQKDYDEKKLSFQRKLHQITVEKAYLEENIGQQKNISKRMSQLRQTLENEKEIEETLKTMNMPEFFQTLKEEVREYYGV